MTNPIDIEALDEALSVVEDPTEQGAVLIQAAKLLRDICPDLMEMVEAWNNVPDNNSSYENARIADLKFNQTAANATARIAERMKG